MSEAISGKPAEPTFVVADGSDPRSDEGYVLSYVHDVETRRRRSS